MSVQRGFRASFATGLLLVAPFAVTIVVLLFAYRWLAGFVDPVLTVVVGDTNVLLQFATLALLVVTITALGALARHGLGGTAVAEFDELMERIPIVSTLYAGTRQASTALADREDQFDRVAIVEWPRAGLRTIGFVTGETPDELDLDADEQAYTVFVPMTPNPTGGFMAIVPESDLVMTDIDVSEAFRLVVTSGMSGHDHVRPTDFE